MDLEKNKDNANHKNRSKISKGIGDTLRVAPFGESLGVIGLACLLANIELNSIVGAISSSVALTLGTVLVVSQHQIKKRLEKITKKHGYHDQVFEKTVTTWCDRQTARIVAENHGKLAEYKKLCDKNKDKIELPDLPHF